MKAYRSSQSLSIVAIAAPARIALLLAATGSGFALVPAAESATAPNTSHGVITSRSVLVNSASLRYCVISSSSLGNRKARRSAWRVQPL